MIDLKVSGFRRRAPALEHQFLSIVAELNRVLKIPMALKLSRFYSFAGVTRLDMESRKHKRPTLWSALRV